MDEQSNDSQKNALRELRNQLAHEKATIPKLYGGDNFNKTKLFEAFKSCNAVYIDGLVTGEVKNGPPEEFENGTPPNPRNRIERAQWWIDRLKVVCGKCKRRLSPRRTKGFVEFVSCILPKKIRTEAFEPAYNDAKADYLITKAYDKSKLSCTCCTFVFRLHVVLMVGQCFWGMCCDKTKRTIMGALPDVFRKL
jgi:hypothetical protein